MIVFSLDNRRTINVGSETTWRTVLNTVEIRLENCNSKFPLALKFLRTGSCIAEDAHNTAKQINMIRDAFSLIAPKDAVYYKNNPSKPAPWANNISDISTSCANFFTTSEGKDLLYEIVSILTYSSILNVDISCDGYGTDYKD